MTSPAALSTVLGTGPVRRRTQGPTDADLLFDAPGPRGRRRILWASVLISALLAALVALALYQADQAGQLAYPKWRYFLGRSTVAFLGSALRDTLIAAGIAALLSFPLGVLLGWIRLARSAAVRLVVGTWIDAMRAIPMLLLIYFFLLAVPPLTGYALPTLWMLVVPIVMCSSATTAEVFRAGVMALDKGQGEAAQALGMSRGLTMRLILAPQALRLMLPTLITQLVTILKDTSLGYVVAYNELMYAGRRLETFARSEYRLDIYLQTYLVIALLYLLANWALGVLARRVEARTRL
ncbi:amino acid ABC transporter permease [Actinomyces bowdenii]|uniref:Amino acid ABC transporter permease n=1 Tax=Actinomyces bowdenii TaxID=131109 RepID=A0A3P1V6Z8_9ACTO|nr:amino acid ABC transporter permease [Actinomyces bowdenii]MBO3724348.1 amino acid ABC transporter permease [Actinomyces bowdenii]RRD29436.1 amino acid ABC transporter permease [Actinomyces bowdenii]